MRSGRQSANVRNRIEAARLCRKANELIEGVSEGFRDPAAEFFCECGDSRCSKRIRLTLAEYEAIRAAREHFLTVPGHEWSTPLLRVIETNERFSLVEERAQPAAEPDPSADRRSVGRARAQRGRMSAPPRPI